MRKMLLGTIVAFAMTILLIPCAALADGVSCDVADCNHEAVIGELHYDTLEEAVKAAESGDEITVINDVELEATLEINKETNKTITIVGDASKPTITVKGTAKDGSYTAGIIIYDGSVTLKNLEINTATSATGATAIISIPRASTLGDKSPYLIADNLTVSLQGDTGTGNVAAFKLWAGKAEISNSLINCYNTKAPPSAMLKGISLITINAEITNTTILGAYSNENNEYSAAAIEIWDNVTAVIDGCTIDSVSSGIAMAKLDPGSSTATIRNTNIQRAPEAGVEIQGWYDVEGLLTINIESGSFNGKVWSWRYNNVNADVMKKLNIDITGGDFDRSVAAYVNDSLKYEAQNNGRFTYHPTLSSALANGGDIKTLAVARNDSSGNNPAIVTLEPNNGDEAMKITAYAGEKISLPTLSRSGYNFLGWYDDNNNRVDTLYEVSGNTILTAQWELPYTGSYNYPVTVPTDVSNGSLSIDQSDRWATDGEKITITVTPDAGYMLDELTITDGSGKEIAVTDNGDGTYTFTIPASGVNIEASFVEDPDYEEPSDEPEAPTDVADIFTDVEAGAWYKNAVQYVFDNGIMTGTSATTFEPNTTTTRGMIVSMLHRLEGAPAAAGSSFSDVATGAWYADPVAWAASEGIVGGYGDGTFQPNKTITREELASILYRYAEYKGIDTSDRADLSRYTDTPSVWAMEVMQWANAEGLITGRTATTIDAQGMTTRAECAAIFQRFIQGNEI